jgi:hypothetical protein
VIGKATHPRDLALAETRRPRFGAGSRARPLVGGNAKRHQ